MIPSAFYLCSMYKAQQTDMSEECHLLGLENVQSERGVPTFQRILLSPSSDVMKHLFTYKMRARNFHQMYNSIISHKTLIFITTTKRMPIPTLGLLLLIFQIQENMAPVPCTLAHCQTRNMKTVIFIFTFELYTLTLSR